MKIIMIGWVLTALSLSACGGAGGGSGRGAPDSILFFGNDVPGSVPNWELWRSDGTREGTRLLRDLNETSGSLNHHNTSMARWSEGANFFVADDGVHGRELWFSDGTAAGTRMVREIRPGTDSTAIDGLYMMEGVVYFGANDGETGLELWRSDGTRAGTQRLLDLVAGSCSSFPGSFNGLGNTLYFVARAECDGSGMPWRLDLTDGTVAHLFDGAGYISYLRAFNDRVYFVQNDDGRKYLWVSFGSMDQTFPVVVDEEGTQAEVSDNIWRMGSSLFFAASNREEGVELYRVDDTGRHARLVRDIAEGEASSNPFSFTVIGEHGYFAADDGQGRSIWRTDGSAEGTVRVTDSNIVGPGNIFNIQSYDDRIVFRIEHGSQRALWITDGTPQGTLSLLSDPLISSINSYRHVNGLLLFSARHSQFGEEMWRTDGTPEGTFMIQDLCPGTCNGY